MRPPGSTIRAVSRGVMKSSRRAMRDRGFQKNNKPAVRAKRDVENEEPGRDKPGIETKQRDESRDLIGRGTGRPERLCEAQR